MSCRLVPSPLLLLGVFAWALPGLTLASTYTVSSLADAGSGTLREAIGLANSNPGWDSILFSPGLAGGTITVASNLPTVTDGGLWLDGDTDGDGEPNITVSGGGTCESAFIVTSANNVLTNLAMGGFTSIVVWVSGANANGNVVEGCHVGVDITGHHSIAGTSLDDYWSVIHISDGAADNVVAGNMIATVNAGCVEMSWGASGTRVTGNWIGTTPDNDPGVKCGSNGVGMNTGAHDTVVTGNVFRNCTLGAMWVGTWSTHPIPSDLVVQDNLVAACGNGLVIDRCPNTTLARNTVDVPGKTALALGGAETTGTIEDNVATAGNIAVGSGAVVSGVVRNTLGGGSLLVGNAQVGAVADNTLTASSIVIYDSQVGPITGNSVEDSPAQGIALYNASQVSGAVSGNTVEVSGGTGILVDGGSVPEVSGNTISGCDEAGITVKGAHASEVFDNDVADVGTDGIVCDGTGVRNVHDNTITGFGDNGIAILPGGEANVEANEISGATGWGFGVWTKTASATITGNTILGVPNAGIGICCSSFDTLVEGNEIEACGAGVGVHSGSVAEVRANTIHDNDASAVVVGSSLYGTVATALISRNTTYDNGDIGIDIDADGVTANDGARTPGASNELLDFPEIVSVEGVAGGTRTLHCTAPPNTTVEVFTGDGDPSGYGEGMTFLHEVNVGATGEFVLYVADSLLPITMTASDVAAGITSEFSAYDLPADDPPTAPDSVLLSPADAVDGDDLVALASGSTDPENDPIAYVYQWRSKVGAAGGWSDWADGTGTLPAAATTVGERWQVRAKAVAGGLESAWVESNLATIRGITLAPNPAACVAGDTVAFTVTDQDGADVTDEAAFAIVEAGHGGAFAANVYTSHTVGLWTVAASFGRAGATAALTVTHAPAATLSIVPATATIAMGGAQPFAAAATDAFGNSWNASWEASWSIEAAAGGSFANSGVAPNLTKTYTAGLPGWWTVTAWLDAGSDTSQLGVTALLAWDATDQKFYLTGNAADPQVGGVAITASGIYGGVEVLLSGVEGDRTVRIVNAATVPNSLRARWYMTGASMYRAYIYSQIGGTSPQHSSVFQRGVTVIDGVSRGAGYTGLNHRATPPAPHALAYTEALQP